MNKKFIVCLSYVLILGSTLPVLADFACPTSCLSPVACPPCNPCRPNCLVSGCFTVDAAGQVISQQGNGFVVASAVGADAITSGYTVPFIVTLVNPFCSQLVVIAQQSFGGVEAGTIPLDAANLATGGRFTLRVRIPASPTGGAIGAPTNTVCFIGVPAV